MGKRSGPVATVIAAVVIFLGAGTAFAGGAPPGNNGTIKVQDGDLDDSVDGGVPDNDPHVSCLITIEWRGYDADGEDTLEASVLIEAHPPTGSGEVLVDDNAIPIGEDGAGGAGDLDASRTYDLTDALVALGESGVDPHPTQGWHVKITVHADGSQGNDTKHKVVWVEDCRPEPEPEPEFGAVTVTKTIEGDPAPEAADAFTFDFELACTDQELIEFTITGQDQFVSELMPLGTVCELTEVGIDQEGVDDRADWEAPVYTDSESGDVDGENVVTVAEVAGVSISVLNDQTEDVLPTVLRQPPTPTPSPAPLPQVAATEPGLPRTGAGLARTGLAALAILAIGGWALLAGRLRLTHVDRAAPRSRRH